MLGRFFQRTGPNATPEQQRSSNRTLRFGASRLRAQTALTPRYRSIKINHRISVILLQSGKTKQVLQNGTYGTAVIQGVLKKYLYTYLRAALRNKPNFYRILSDASRIERALLALHTACGSELELFWVDCPRLRPIVYVMH
jgi:hypothetical protein